MHTRIIFCQYNPKSGRTTAIDENTRERTHVVEHRLGKFPQHTLAANRMARLEGLTNVRLVSMDSRKAMYEADKE